MGLIPMDPTHRSSCFLSFSNAHLIPGTVEISPESSGTSQTGSSGGQHAIGPSHSGSNGQSNTGAQSDAGSEINNSNGKGSGTGDNQAIPAPVVGISYAGSSITPETSSHYSIPKIGKLNLAARQ